MDNPEVPDDTVCANCGRSLEEVSGKTIDEIAATAMEEGNPRIWWPYNGFCDAACCAEHYLSQGILIDSKFSELAKGDFKRAVYELVDIVNGNAPPPEFNLINTLKPGGD